MKNIKLSDNVAPIFYPIFQDSDYEEIILPGGRSSTKSSVVSIKLVLDSLEDTNCNTICLRQVANTLLNSVFKQILWAMELLDVRNEYKVKRSPLTITHKKNGTVFLFAGLDDPAALKSMVAEKGYYKNVWIEEAAEVKSGEVVDTVMDTFIRQKLPDGAKVKTYLTFNPPKSKNNWINKYTKDKEVNGDKALVIRSTYKDIMRLGFISEQFLNKVKRIKETDYNYYLWQYEGNSIGLSNEVYNCDTIKVVKDFKPQDELLGIYYSIDAGHANSAMVCGAYVLTKKFDIYLVDQYYHSPANEVIKKAPSDLVVEIRDFIIRTSNLYNTPILNRTIDSAEQATVNEFYKLTHIKLKKIKKLSKVNMIAYSQQIMAEGRFYVFDNDNNKIFLEQMKNYSWDPKYIESDEPRVLKENDDCCDQYQYACVANMRAWRIKV